MIGKRKERWYSGHEIMIMGGVQGFELLAACEKRLLTAYSKDTGSKINLRMLKKYCTVDEAKNFLYKATQVEAFLEKLIHENEQADDICPSGPKVPQHSPSLESTMKEARVKGGRASKINQPIMEAAKRYISDKSSRIEESAFTIAASFKRKHNSSNPSEITIDSNVYEIYCDGNKVCSSCNTEKKNKYHEKSISYGTFLSKYIPKAKSELESSKINNI